MFEYIDSGIKFAINKYNQKRGKFWLHFVDIKMYIRQEREILMLEISAITTL